MPLPFEMRNNTAVLVVVGLSAVRDWYRSRMEEDMGKKERASSRCTESAIPLAASYKTPNNEERQLQLNRITVSGLAIDQ